MGSGAWRKIKYENRMTNSQTNESDRYYKITRFLDSSSVRRKKTNQCNKQHELTSPNVGLKVRRSIQNNYEFSNNYTRD
jgi:hypothetical protein